MTSSSDSESVLYAVAMHDSLDSRRLNSAGEKLALKVGSLFLHLLRKSAYFWELGKVYKLVLFPRIQHSFFFI